MQFWGNIPRMLRGEEELAVKVLITDLVHLMNQGQSDDKTCVDSAVIVATSSLWSAQSTHVSVVASAKFNPNRSCLV